MKNENIFEEIIKISDAKTSLFLFRVSEKSLECIELALFFISKWHVNFKLICEKIMKDIYLKASNEYKFKVIFLLNQL